MGLIANKIKITKTNPCQCQRFDCIQTSGIGHSAAIPSKITHLLASITIANDEHLLKAIAKRKTNYEGFWAITVMTLPQCFIRRVSMVNFVYGRKQYSDDRYNSKQSTGIELSLAIVIGNQRLTWPIFDIDSTE